MTIKPEYKLKTLAGEHIVVPTGQEAVAFNGILTLNNSGKQLFERLQTGATIEDLVQLLLDTYEVTKERAEQDVESFLSILRQKDILIP
jgi:hypothetical protein